MAIKLTGLSEKTPQDNNNFVSHLTMLTKGYLSRQQNCYTLKANELDNEAAASADFFAANKAVI